MIYSLKELVTPPTRAEATAAIYSVMGAVGVTTTNWKPGAVMRTMITAVAILYVASATLIALIARSGFLELAAGAWLDLVAYYVYGVTRQEATFAEGDVTLTNSGGGVYNYEANDVIVKNGAGVTYRNTEAFTLLGASSLEVSVRAIEAGIIGTTAANTIEGFETEISAQYVTVTNANALIGAERERDPALRTKCLDKLGALSPNGPKDAYAYFARNAKFADGTSAGVTRVRVVHDAYSNVTTYIGTASGGIEGAEEDGLTALGVVHDNIQRNAVPLSINETTVSATGYSFSVSYSVWAYSSIGMTAAELRDEINAALTAFFVDRPIGGDEIEGNDGAVYVSALRAVIRVRPEIFRVIVHTPSDDVPLMPYHAPTVGSLAALEITQVAPPTL